MAGNHNSGNKPNNKSTKAEIERRIELSAIYLVENPDSGYKDYCDWAKAQFGVEKDMANKYRQRAATKVGALHSDDLESAKRIATASLNKMLRKANDAGDVKLALSIRQEMNKINGLYTQKIEVNSKEDVSLYKVDTTKKEYIETKDLKVV